MILHRLLLCRLKASRCGLESHCSKLFYIHDDRNPTHVSLKKINKRLLKKWSLASKGFSAALVGFDYYPHNWWSSGNKNQRGAGWKPGNLLHLNRGFIVDVLSAPPHDVHVKALPRKKSNGAWLPLKPGSKRSDWNGLIPCYAENKCQCAS